jgi:hypothetical protein
VPGTSGELKFELFTCSALRACCRNNQSVAACGGICGPARYPVGGSRTDDAIRWADRRGYARAP